jgi:hypothetical protein
MYFDSWSTSYFFWVIICFAVWGFAGFSVYGAISVFARKAHRKEKPVTLTPERIKEIKVRAEQEAAMAAYLDEQERIREKENREAVIAAEMIANFREPEEVTPEKEAVWVAGSQAENEDAALAGKDTEMRVQNELLRKIYEREIEESRKREEEAPDAEELPGLAVDVPVCVGAAPTSEKEKSTEPPQKEVKWVEIEDIYRTAFRR